DDEEGREASRYDLHLDLCDRCCRRWLTGFVVTESVLVYCEQFTDKPAPGFHSHQRALMGVKPRDDFIRCHDFSNASAQASICVWARAFFSHAAALSGVAYRLRS